MPAYLVHAMEGRARLRHPALADAGQRGLALALLGGEPGVLETRPGSGSLLLILAPDADLAGICKNLEAALPDLTRSVEDIRAERALARKAARGAVCKKAGRAAARVVGRKPSHGLTARKLELRALLGSLGLSLLMGVVGKGRVHVLAGTAFGLLAAQHIWQRRKML